MQKRATRNKKPETSNGPVPRLIVRSLLRWFATNARDLPWRRTRDPYAIWVSEIMLQQTQVKTVIPYWERWMRELPTLQSLATAKPDTIHKLWEGLGYYTRVRNMQKAAQQIVAQQFTGRRRGDESHTGGKMEAPHVVTYKFPENIEDILALPGIGRYTAGAIASIAFNQPAPILDGNVIRVLCRLHGIADDPQEKQTNARLWKLAEELVTDAERLRSRTRTKGEDDAACSHLNQSLMELGALICTPRSPKCSICPVAKHCVARGENRVEELPRPKQRTEVTERHFTVFVVEQKGSYLVQQRGADVVNAHLWEFPNREANGKADAAEPAQQEFGIKPSALHPLCTVKHSITRYRITAKAYRVEFGPKKIQAGNNRRWCTRDELASLAFTAAHRRIAEKLRNR